MFNNSSMNRKATSGKSQGVDDKTMRSKGKIPSYFLCPITLELMEDPTITQCGHMFDREAIVKWIVEDRDGKKGCPLCHQKISESSLAPCFPLKAAIAEFKSKKGSNEGVSTLECAKERGDKEPEAPAPPQPEKVRKHQSSPPEGKEDDRRSKDKHQRRSHDKGERSEKSERHKHRSKHSSSAHESSHKKSKRVWCKLKPILNTFEPLDIKGDEFTLGRNSHCDHVIQASEISSVHCTIYRVASDAPGEYDYFIEDKSTNGTYLNGNRIGKGLIASFTDGDELSLGEKFSSKVVPKVSAFVDWVFLGADLTPERKADVAKVKEFDSFFQLIEMDDEEWKDYGIRSNYVRGKLLEATKSWLDKYRFPAYKIELPSKKKENSDDSRENLEGNGKRAFSPNQSRSNNDLLGESSELSFDPSHYAERASAGVVCMYLKRAKSSVGPVQIKVKSTDKSTLPPGDAYQPFERVFTMAEGSTDLTVEFFWSPDKIATPNARICFEASIVSGNARMGKNPQASLDIEMSVSRSKKSSNSAPILRRRETDEIKRSDERIVDNSDDIIDGMGEKEKARIQDLEDDILAIMMESFPQIEPHKIASIIRQEREMMAPLEDRYLLQDMVAIKLTNLTESPDERSHTNIKMMKISQHDTGDEPTEDPSAIVSGNDSKVVVMPVPTPIQAPAPAEAQPPGVGKIKQTVLRCELESFLFMASISLIRKFFTIQGIECNYAHFANPVVNISVNLAQTFLRTLDSVRPLATGQDRSRDILDFDDIVELFKKYIFQNGSELRAQAVQLDPKALATGYKYDVAFQKSSHHFKMENNHAIIEDLNRVAGLGPDQPMNSFFGVFDGHGGYLVSEYLSLHLASNIARQSTFSKNIIEAIRAGYQKTDDLVIAKNLRDKIRGGSTSVTAIIRENNIYVAWAGDARCIVFRRMGSSLVAFPIVTPHNPQGSEKQRVVKAGGYVEFIAGKWRVNGRLAVTRSFGDENLKPVVISEPEIVKFPLMGDEEFLMLSCDGLYDVMDYSDVAEYFDSCLKKGMKLGQLAAAMVQEGVQRKSTDDITVMLVNLSRNPNM